MLDKTDLSKKTERREFKEKKEAYKIRIGQLQRKIKDLGIPVIVIFEGWDASGKGTLISNLIQPLDPRGFKVHLTKKPGEEELYRPFLWEFWKNIPAKGRIAIFDKSWYDRSLCLGEHKHGKDIKMSYNEIYSFERQLVDSGYSIIKFFLHIDKKEQKKRFEKIENNRSMKWKVSSKEWEQNENYNKFYEDYEMMFSMTDTETAPWTVIEAVDYRFAVLKMYGKIVEELESRINSVYETNDSSIRKNIITTDDNDSSILDRTDLTLDISRTDYKEKMKNLQKHLRRLEYSIYKKRIGVIVIYEGWDAAGKGGNIKRLTEKLDPRGYEVIPVSAPTDIEKNRHYLWRFWINMPKAGHITIFDRSWYGRVLVERVEGFCNESEWKRAYREINEMEEQFSDAGFVIVKFWLHIDMDEQLKRFNERKNDPDKQWKITDEDWRNREKWNEYKKAVDEMLFRTSTSYAPWTIVESNSKLHARVKALETVINAIEKKLGK